MLGAHLLYRLVLDHSKIRAIKRTGSNLTTVKQVFSFLESNYEPLFDRIEWVEADLMDQQSLLSMMDGIAFVYHAAALVSFNPSDYEKVIRVNSKMTENIVNAALANDVKKLCHVSSIASLGDAVNGEPVTEETFRNPKKRHNGYSVSKYLSELEVWRGITEGLNAVIVNPSVILGAGDWKSGSPGIIDTIYKGMKFYTEGSLGYVDVLDVADSMIKLMESGITGERFIISAECLSYKELFTEIANHLGVKPPGKKAGPFVLEVAWRLEYLKSKLTASAPRITKEMARLSQKKSSYSSEKLLNAIDFEYTDLKKSIKRITANFKSALNP